MTWMTSSEIKLGLRLMRRQPILSLTAILTLAVGIGLATVGFAVVDSVTNGILPLPDGDRFVRIRAWTVPAGRAAPIDPARSEALRGGDPRGGDTGSFEHVGAFAGGQINLIETSGLVEPVRGNWITPSSFARLPYVPIRGRTLIEADAESGAPPVVVLRDSLWQRRFAGRDDIIGTEVDLGGIRRTVVGVLDDDAGFPAGGDVWIPLGERALGAGPVEERVDHQLFGILRDGVALATAEAEVAALEAPPAAGDGTATELRVTPFTEPPRGFGVLAPALVTVLVLVLVVIASNVANLILARTASRGSELAVRSALGASRGRIVGQLTLEVGLLAAVAAGIAMVAGRWVIRKMDVLLTEGPFWIELGLTARTVAFVVAISVLVSLIGGVVPALRSTRRQLGAALHRDDRGTGILGLGRLGSAMMVIEVALSVALLASALMVARGYVNHVTRDLDLPDDRVLTARIQLEEAPKIAPATLASRLRDALGALDDVSAVGVTRNLPRHDAPARQVVVAPEAGEPERAPLTMPVAVVGPGFLEAIGARAMAGRLPRALDVAEHALPVAIVNEPFVARALNGGNAIGRRLRVVRDDDPRSAPAWREIVGVVPDLGLSSSDPARAAGIYLPYDEALPGRFDIAIRRDAGDPLTLAGALRRQVVDLDASVIVRDIQLLGQVNADERAFFAGFGATLTAMGLLTLMLSMAGIYAMISFTVVRRTREIGIRMALGASRGSVLKTIALTSGTLVLAGTAIGSVLAVFGVRFQDAIFVTRLPTEVSAVLPAVVVLFAGAGLAACWLPARRALNIRPAEALRAD